MIQFDLRIFLRWVGKQPPTSEFTVSRPFRIHQASTVKERDSLRKMKITEALWLDGRIFPLGSWVKLCFGKLHSSLKMFHLKNAWFLQKKDCKTCRGG